MSPHGTDPSDTGLPPGTPTVFDLGRLAGHVESMGREIRDLKEVLADKVTHGEFQRAMKNMTVLSLLILAAIIGLAFAALHP